MTARYQFLPWVRQGAARVFKNADSLAPVLTRSDGKPLNLFPVQLKINAQPLVDVTLRMYGPGDLTGIDPRVVIRVDPPPYSADFEPNYLACIEFDPPDFPWLFTPASAGQKGRLRPWLVLVVVQISEEVRLESAAGRILPTLNAPVSELPDLEESWAWAHGQVVQPDPSQEVGHILADLPNQNLSRLICPRRLRPTTRYLACLVPAFDAGRKAGLEMEVTAADQDSLRPAWESTQTQVRLPVYYHWEFSTGSGGDFESLASRLVGRPVPPGIGQRPLRVENQPYGLPDLGVVVLEGALRSTEPPPLPELDPRFRDELRVLLNLSATQPVVTPPLFGHWQSSQTVIPGEAELPAWFRQLNLDPANRVPAGFGTRVVQERQEQLVASAWEQLGDARGVVQLERRLEFAVELLGSVMRRRVEPMEVGQMVQFLGPAQTHMRASPETLRASLSRQGLPPAFSSGSFQRALRPAGSLSRKTETPRRTDMQTVANRLGTQIPPIEPAPGTIGLITLELVKGFDIFGQRDPAQQRFRDAAAEAQLYFDRFTRQFPIIPKPPFAFTATFKSSLVTSLNPQQTASLSFYAQISSADGPAQPPARPGESVIPGPSFPQPMYEALRDLSPEFLLPGVAQIDPDTVTLLNSNPRFIEAYMIGLNHEMASELIWREFPSDLRQTYFREFWDTRGALQPISQLPDIHTWNQAASLGNNFSSGGEQLVLLVRGELLQRYPDALIYAIRAKTLNTLGDEQKFPLFRGRIEPDITFLGFDLTDEIARGIGSDPGWFFAIQEQPSAPRFGMDDIRTKPLLTWNDLGWSDMTTPPGEHIDMEDLNAQPPPGLVWGFNAAHLAGILRQRPVRVSMHARVMLPPAPEIEPTPPQPPPRPPRPPRPPVTPPDPLPPIIER
jgi:hypothetical protein